MKRTFDVRRWASPMMLVLVALLLLLPAGLVIARGVDDQKSAPAAAPAGEIAMERWYAIMMNGQRAGSMQATQERRGDRIHTRTVMDMAIGRGAVTVKLSMESESVETLEGRPVSVRTLQSFGQQPMELVYTFGEKETTLVTRQGGREATTTMDPPTGEFLMPARAQAELKRRLLAGEKRIEMRTLDPNAGAAPIITTRSDIRRQRVTVNGREIEVFRAVSTTSAAPGVESIEYIDDEGVAVRYTANLGGIAIEFEEAAPEQARARIAKAPELMVSTFVRPDRVIADPRGLRRSVLVLSVGEGAMPDLPNTAVQRVERVDERTLRLTIDLDAPSAAPEGDKGDAALLASSSMISSADAAVRGLVASATRKAGEDPAARARAMRRFVHEFIDRKALDTALGSAAETARTRAGDCTEHAVLLAAMLRADGIPARVASGLVYADQFAGEMNIFGYHMWTQALLEVNGTPTWVDLDAALGGGNPDDPAFDATHIATNVSAMADGDLISPFMSTAQVMGRLRIAVEEPK